ncbi:MAG: hypothetical protein ABI612_21305 [Betaproteobacteria bacterium]
MRWRNNTLAAPSPSQPSEANHDDGIDGRFWHDREHLAAQIDDVHIPNPSSPNEEMLLI